jgi:phosphomethylpyrimidine synthase
MLAKETPPPPAPPRLFMIATKNSFEPHSSDALPNSKRVYLPGALHPRLRVPLREISLRPTSGRNGRAESNEAVRVYDCSGPWGDENYMVNVRHGLPPLRREWILERGDVDEIEGRAGAAENNGQPANGAASDLPLDATHIPQRRPLRAKAGRVVTQLQYARQGVITPEMEFIAIRENMGREMPRDTGELWR